MALMVRRYSEVLQLESIVYYIHFSYRVRKLAADVYQNLILSCAHMSLVVGKCSNSPRWSFCMQGSIV